ncbi:MAG: cupin domain-containing protein [Methylobacterium sp.]|nr:cupin domain-containing protein [Methylobacterium sp.]
MAIAVAPWPNSTQIEAEFAEISELWSPRVVASANGQYLKLAKVEGELVWHAHADEDELFIIHRGTFGLRYRDGREVILRAGDVHCVPKGVEHLPFTVGGPAYVMFFEPATTKHTGDTISERTRSLDQQTAHLASKI